MDVIARNIQGIMVIAGGLNVAVGYAAVAPSATVQSTFGETLSEPLVELLVRNWGVPLAVLAQLNYSSRLTWECPAA